MSPMILLFAALSLFFLLALSLIGTLENPARIRKWRWGARLAAIAMFVCSVVPLCVAYAKSRIIRKAVVRWAVEIPGSAILSREDLQQLSRPGNGQPEKRASRPVPFRLAKSIQGKLWDLPYKMHLYLSTQARLEALAQDVRPILTAKAGYTDGKLQGNLHLHHLTRFKFPQRIDDYVLIVLPPYVPGGYMTARTFPEVLYEVDFDGGISLIVESQQEIPWFDVADFDTAREIESGGYVLVQQTDVSCPWRLRSLKLEVRARQFELYHRNVWEYLSISGEGQRGDTEHKQFIGLISGGALPEDLDVGETGVKFVPNIR